MGKDPSMPFYVNDWLSSPRVQAMTEMEELAYFRLCLFCWASGDASLPDDDQYLARISRMGEGWLKGGCDLVRRCFIQHPTKAGHITNETVFRLWQERQQWREKSRLGGVNSGKKRRYDIKKTSKGGSRVVEPKGKPSSSSSSSLNTPLPPLPDSLLPTCVETWEAFVAHRREIKAPLTPRSAGMILKKLASWGPEAAIAAMENAIASSWKGVFEPDGPRRNGHRTQLSPELDPDKANAEYNPG